MPSSLGVQFRRAIARAGLPVVRATQISRAGSAAAFRIDLASGGAVKARVFSRASDGVAVWTLLKSLKRGILPQPVCHLGRLLVVEYVQGSPISVNPRARTLADVRQAGALMARLHATRLTRAARQRAIYPAEGFLSRVMSSLVRRRLIDRVSATRLGALPVPRSTRLVMTHGDLCPENLVRESASRLRAIDEERLAVRPAAFDLARTITRWPLTSAEERVFLRSYARAGGVPDDFARHRTFWLATALAVSARYRMKRGLPGVRGIARALYELLPARR